MAEVESNQSRMLLLVFVIKKEAKVFFFVIKKEANGTMQAACYTREKRRGF